MLNQIALVGRLTREPELFQSNSGNQTTRFALAFNQGKNPDGTEDTGFIDITTFGTLANTCSEWLSKGDKVAVTGRIYQKKFTRKDGSKGSVYEVIADSIEFLDPKPETPKVDEDELPFDVTPTQEPKFDPMTGKPLNKTTKK